MSILIKNVLVDGKQKDILIRNNKIEDIKKSIVAETDYKIDGKHKAAIPSFVNAHTHAAMNLMRGYADDMMLHDWLQNKIWPLETKLTEKDVYYGTKFACLEMIKSGTTFFNDMYWHLPRSVKAVEEIGMRGALNAVFIDMFDEEKTKEQIKLNKRLFEETRNASDRVQFTLGPHAVYTVSEESLCWAKEFADKHNLIVHIHLSETQKEVDDCIAKTKRRPVEYLDHIGFLGPNVVAAHTVWVNDKEIKLLKKHNVKVAHNPCSNMKLCSGVLPYKKLKKAGITVALGTDGSASNNSLNMLKEMKFAALLQKHHNRDPTLLPAEEAFKLGTVNGAKAFGLNAGEIAKGKLADLLLIDLKHLSLNPHHNMISNLVYSSGADCIDTTICDGNILMQNRKVKGEEKILEDANKIALDLVARK